ncbi:hypothetical protein [Salibacter halophilus]|uniref:Uncharacterized protein n=1 Tax=Salibacter halophilus TaxID=1803916 RepID=A0A6N6M5A5_9FLAO|nr:hypothetical protein [Salibacter halophilus]KAB1061975.1 hypothetical protein F3059_12920 [Salibacter halophilus]
MKKSNNKSLRVRFGCNYLGFHKWAIIDKTKPNKEPYSRICQYCEKREVIHNGVVLIIDQGS